MSPLVRELPELMRVKSTEDVKSGAWSYPFQQYLVVYCWV